jgi:hypothetical protein
MPSYVHHAVAHGGTSKYANSRNDYNRFVSRNFGADGRVQEVHSVVAHAHHKVENGKDNKEYHYSEK